MKTHHFFLSFKSRFFDLAQEEGESPKLGWERAPPTPECKPKGSSFLTFLGVILHKAHILHHETTAVNTVSNALYFLT